MRAPDRYIVFNVGPYSRWKSCQRRVLTSYGDAAKSTQRCSRGRANKPCFLLQGHPGAEKLIGRCVNNKCGRPKEGDQAIIDRCKLEKKSRRDLIASRAGKTLGRARNKRRRRK